MATLMHFQEPELVLSADQAKSVLLFFFGEGDMPTTLTIEDRSFAQALLIEAIDGSYHMGFINAIWDAIFDKNILIGNLTGIVKSFIKSAIKNWFKHYKVDISKLNDVQIYRSVKVTLVRNFRSPWAIRTQTGELMY